MVLGDRELGTGPDGGVVTEGGKEKDEEQGEGDEEMDEEDGRDLDEEDNGGRDEEGSQWTPL